VTKSDMRTDEDLYRELDHLDIRDLLEAGRGIKINTLHLWRNRVACHLFLDETQDYFDDRCFDEGEYDDGPDTTDD